MIAFRTNPLKNFWVGDFIFLLSFFLPPKNLLTYLRERERERERTSGDKGQRRKRSRCPAKHRARLGAWSQDPEIMTKAERRCLTPETPGCPSPGFWHALYLSAYCLYWPWSGLLVQRNFSLFFFAHHDLARLSTHCNYSCPLAMWKKLNNSRPFRTLQAIYYDSYCNRHCHWTLLSLMSAYWRLTPLSPCLHVGRLTLLTF